MAFTLQLTGASGGDINLNDQTKPSVAHPYSILVKDWRPRVARRRTGKIGGLPFDDVEEVMPLAVLGYTRAAVLDGLGDLAAALDEAQLWFVGQQGVGPILLKWLPDGSSLANAVQAAVLGPGGGDDLLSLQPAFNKDLQAYYVECDLALIRRGIWVGQETTITTADRVAHPNVFDLSGFTDEPAVEKIVIESMRPDANTNGYLVISRSADSIDFIEAEDSYGFIQFVAAAEAGASGGDVAVMGYGITYDTGTIYNEYANQRAGKYMLLATISNESSSIQCTATCTIKRLLPAATDWEPYGDAIRFDVNDGPRIVNFGIYSLYSADLPTIYFKLTITMDSVPAVATDLIKVDSLAWIYLEDSVVIGFPNTSLLNTGGAWGLTVDHALLEKQAGHVYWQLRPDLGDLTSILPFYGNPTILTDGTATYGIWYALSDGYWRPVEGGVPMDKYVTSTRRPYYLIPK